MWLVNVEETYSQLTTPGCTMLPAEYMCLIGLCPLGSEEFFAGLSDRPGCRQNNT